VHSIQGHPRNAREVAFLPGGIGTCNVPTSVGGEFRDSEIVNGPGRGNYLLSLSPYSARPGTTYRPLPGSWNLC